MTMAESHHTDDASEAGMITIPISHRKTTYDFEFHDDAVVKDLFNEIADTLDIPLENQKIIVPKAPLLTWPPKDPDMPLQSLQRKKLMLMGSGAATAQAVHDMSEKVAKRNAARAAQRAKRKAPGQQRRNRIAGVGDSTYTFLQVEPLRNLPHPERSQALLMRLKADPGIVATMRKHKFTVALLTEMEPLSHTQVSHEGTSRILGLNRNKGEVIELRLRTDAYDGYRDYKTIRKTLCHELAHNVHSDHDRNFWDLCNQIEREVLGSDWKSGGHTLDPGVSSYTTRGEEEEHEDEGGWTGGEFVLGGVKEAPTGTSRREILAQAAMERQRKEDQSEHKADCGWRPCQRPHRGDERE